MTTRFIYVDNNISSKLVSVVARLSCSSNMLEGDTGYDIIKHSKIQWSDILSYYFHILFWYFGYFTISGVLFGHQVYSCLNLFFHTLKFSPQSVALRQVIGCTISVRYITSITSCKKVYVNMFSSWANN